MASEAFPSSIIYPRSSATLSSLQQDVDSDEDSYQGAAMNLLDIRNPSRWENTAMPSSATQSFSSDSLAIGNAGPRSSDGSITKLYQPKFLQVFQKFSQSLSRSVDISKPLMAVCLEQLVAFSCWARESAARSAWIRSTLEENSDLRPEVRNGLSMILIYCLSAAKVEPDSEEDMFTILQETETGLGIVNKTSLKIYNDPFHYFDFLKACISGLIDAGKVPENERQNQPRKAKRMAENKEEVRAFEQLQEVLVDLLQRGENALARAKVQQISNLWHHRQKSIRGRRFVSALVLLAGGSQQPIGFPSFEADNPASLVLASIEAQAALAATKLPALIGAAESLPSAFSSASSFPVSHLSSNESVPPPTKMSRSALMSTTRSSAWVPALRFERVSGTEWHIQENKVFNVEALLLSQSGAVGILDESKLTSVCQDGRLVSPAVGMVSLMQVLKQAGVLLTSWPKTDHRQLLDFLESWTAQDKELSLLRYWRLRHQDFSSSVSPRNSNGTDDRVALLDSSNAAQGVLVYETIMQIGIVLRCNQELGIDEDCWRLLYPRDLQSECSNSSASLGAFLTSLFPQLRAAEDQIKAARTVVVKYYTHSPQPPFLLAPKKVDISMYQTIGTLDELAAVVLSRQVDVYPVISSGVSLIVVKQV